MAKAESKAAKKIAEKKEKIAAKCGKAAKCAAVLFALAFVCAGCATSDPSSRSTRGEYGDIRITFDHSCSNVVTVTLGDAAIASADSAGSTETMTATPTLDVRPQTTLNYGLTSSTPSGAKWIDALDGGCAKLLASWLGSGNANGTMEVTKKDGTKETVTCKDGVCTTASGDCITCSGGACSEGACSE